MPRNKFILAVVSSLIIVIGVLNMMYRQSKNIDPVIVVGGGLAGMVSSLEAAAYGARVILIDKARLGGNSAKATSGINSAQTVYQARAHIHDTTDKFTNDILNSAKEVGNPDHAKILSVRSASIIDYLDQHFQFNDYDVQKLGGHSVARTHRFIPDEKSPAPFGWILTKLLREKLASLESITIEENTKVVDFELTEASDGYETISSIKTCSDGICKVITPGAVIFASGGYSASTEPGSIIAEMRPELANFPTTNDPISVGDIQKLGLIKGLDVTNLDLVQLHPTGFIDVNHPDAQKKFLCPEVVRGLGAKLVNVLNEEFVDAMATRDVVSAAIIEQKETVKSFGLEGDQLAAMLIWPPGLETRFGIAAFNFYKKMNLILDYDTATEKFPTFKFDSSISTATHFSLVTPATHFSLGGIQIDYAAHILKGGKPILNAFAAGEVTTGIHGVNRLAGNGCTQSVVYGRLAGAMSAASLNLNREHMVLFSTDNHILVGGPHDLGETILLNIDEKKHPATKLYPGVYQVDLDGSGSLRVVEGDKLQRL